MGVRIRNAVFVGRRIFGLWLAVLCRNLDKTGVFAEPPGNLREAACVRAACLGHPYREAPKSRAHEPKWMKAGLTTLS